MKYPPFLRWLKTICLLAVFSCGLAATSWAQNNAIRHVVQNGETLYRLSKVYGVTAEEIVRLNPGLTAETLTTGREILIPAVPASKDEQPPAAPKARTLHEVKRKETVWSISKHYGLTVDELAAANPEMKSPDFKLKKGMKLIIPFPAEAHQPSVPAASAKGVPKARDTVNVAVLLPLKSKSAEGVRCLEYYRGLLMAAGRLKSQGKCVNVLAFDESAEGEHLSAHLAQMKQRGVDLIFGPVYSQHFASVAAFAKENRIKVLFPFSSKVWQVERNASVFMMNAPEQHKHTYAADLFVKAFPKSVGVIFLESGKGNETAFSTYLKTRLSAAGYETASLPLRFTAAQLKAKLLPGQKFVLVPDGSDAATLETLMPALRDFKKAYGGFETALFGYPEWQTFVSKWQSDFFQANTYVFTNFYYNVYSGDTRSFEADYKRWFHAPLLNVYPRMGLLGYDNGLYMMQAFLKYGRDYAGEDVKCGVHQSDMRFRRISAEGGYVNSALWFIHYKTDKTIERIEAAR